MDNVNQAEKDEYVLTIVREFNAPLSLVFKAFSEPRRLSQWWGPRDYDMSVISAEFKEGGILRFKMESPERSMWARFVYGRIQKEKLIEFTLSFTDENGNVTRAPFFTTWPLEILNRVGFEAAGNKTIITFKSQPVNATAAEKASYIKEMSSFKQGIGATLDALDEFLLRSTE